MVDFRYLKSIVDFGHSVVRFVQTLNKAFPQQSSKISSTPGLVSSVQQDRRYSEALQLYRQQLEQSNRVQAQQSQVQLEFNKRLVELLAEWQANNNKAKKDELQLLWDKDNWFSRLDRQETVEILGQQKHRLLILVAPPDISSDCPDSLKNNLKKEIDNHTRLFLNQYYSDSQYHPIEFYGDYFKEPIAAADVRRLQSILGSIPTAIIYTDISDYQVYFHIAFWGMQGETTQFDMQAWDWEQAFEALKLEGCSETLAHRKIRQTIVVFHQLLAAFITDWYYLNLNLVYEPKLLQSDITFVGLPQEVIAQYIKVLQDLQQKRQEVFEKEEILEGLEEPAEKNYQEPKKSVLNKQAAERKRQQWRKDDGSLKGSNGMSYQRLRDLLASQRWKEGDQETCLLIQKLLNSHCGKWDNGSNLRFIPKSDLLKIDELWIKYSEGKFGFSVQNEIWQSSRFRAEFLQRIGFPEPWVYYHRKIFELSSPRGALPCKILHEIDYATLYECFF